MFTREFLLSLTYGGRFHLAQVEVVDDRLWELMSLS